MRLRNDFFKNDKIKFLQKSYTKGDSYLCIFLKLYETFYENGVKCFLASKNNDLSFEFIAHKIDERTEIVVQAVNALCDVGLMRKTNCNYISPEEEPDLYRYDFDFFLDELK